MKKFAVILISATLFCLSCATDSFGVYHTVKKGENLTKISQLYNIDENELRHENSIPEGVGELKEGSAIFIPGAAEVIETSPLETFPETSPNPEPAPEPVETSQETSPESETSTQPESEPAPVETCPETSPEPEPETETSINFIWPATGKIIKQFSSSAPKSDGIDFQFEKNTEIRAVADGKVIYSASNANFGNMVIIRHNDDFITVYSYLHTIFAKEGQTVKQGDVLGVADATEIKSVPTLHFEVRKAAKPVNPITYLQEN
jgi:Membrane proteins related to metalloendopeptidases